MEHEPYASKEQDGATIGVLEEYEDILSSANHLPKGEPLTYGATPLDRMRTLRQQHDLALDLQAYTLVVPDGVPLEVADYVHRTFAVRFYGRAEANEENYTTALHKDIVTTQYPDLQPMAERCELGQGSPTELMILREIRGIRSVELACVTHPYGSRIELLPEMRGVVKEHVENMGGEYYDTPETRYRVKEIVGLDEGDESFTNGLLMTRKRTIGMLPDGTLIRERSSFLLRTDVGSLFTEDDLAALRAVDRSSDTYQDDLVAAGHLDEIAELLLAMDEPGFAQAIPISTTIYAFNYETAAAILEVQQREAAERRAAFARQYPVIAAAQASRQDGTEVFDYLEGGMLYVGPEITE